MIDKVIAENARDMSSGSIFLVGRENQRALFKELAQMDGFELFLGTT